MKAPLVKPMESTSTDNPELFEPVSTSPDTAHKLFFVPVFKGTLLATVVYALGLTGLANAPGVIGSIGLSPVAVILCGALVSTFFYFKVIKFILTQEHPESAAATMVEDAADIEMPDAGGEGKTVVVVGGGISGLSTAHFLLKAGCKVILLEARDKVGGNNEPFDDAKAKETHATTCVFTSPSQQPHYASLCRDMKLTQTSHELATVEGAVVLNGKAIKLSMGGADQEVKFIARAFWQCTWMEIIDGLIIFGLLFYAFSLRAESAMSVTQLLGPRLSASAVFRDFYMGWIGVNVWCRFDDLEGFPAHSFATFVFEYACPLVFRTLDIAVDRGAPTDACVLDGRLPRALEKANAEHPRFEQHLNASVVKIRKLATSGKQLVVVRRNQFRSGGDVLQRVNAAWEASDAPDEEAALIEFECDAVVLATLPGAGRRLLAASTAAATPEEQQAGLAPACVPASLQDELGKWSEMECFTFIHTDVALAQGKAWVHETLHNQASGLPYAHYAIHPRVGDVDAKYWVSYVYGREHAKDFVAHHVAADKIEELYTPRLPIFEGANTPGRNRIWRRVDLECTDVYWTHCCRSGLQFHNNGILSAKRVVRSILGKPW